MRNVMVFTLALVFTFVLLTSAALAWDDLIYFSGGPVVGDPGNARAALGLRYSTAGDRYDADGEKKGLAEDYTSLRVPIWGFYNVIDNLQAFAILPIVSDDDGANSESGIGDIWLGAKYAVMDEGLLTIRGALDIPTGDDKKDLGNPGGFGIDIGAMTSKKMEKLVLRGQLGIRYNGEDGDTKWKPGIGMYARGDVRYNFTEKFRGVIFLTYFNQGDGEAGGTEQSNSEVNWVDLKIGGTYMITEDLWIHPALIYTLTGTNTSADLSIGIYCGYYFLK